MEVSNVFQMFQEGFNNIMGCGMPCYLILGLAFLLGFIIAWKKYHV